MPRRVKPIAEGCLRTIADFFGPLVAMRPETIGLSDWVGRVLFHVHERVITSYVVVQAFRMPGFYYWLPTKPIQGYGRRAIKPGTEVVVRTDITRPDVVDVETITKLREKPRVFRLSPGEWKKIKRNLKEMK